MKLNLGVTPRKFYYIIVDQINKFFVLGLTNGESKVLAELMFEYYKVQEHSEKDKETLVMNPSNKKEIIKRLGTTPAAFNNTLSRLRKKEGKKGFALIGNTINEGYMIYPDKKFQLTLNFIVDERFGK